MRLFVSIDLPDRLADEVRAVQEPLVDADGLNLIDPEQAHVTLKFLGDVSEDRLSTVAEAIRRGVADAGVDPFEATFEGLGAFPSLDYISVVWFGVRDGSEEMTRLAAAIESRAVDAGFDPEDHEFTPHVTLARMDHAGSKELVQRLVEERSPEIGSTTVEEVRLTESTLTADGPVYSTVERFPLGSTEP